MDRLLLVLVLVACATAVDAARSIIVSPNFAYYKDRSADSIAEEISVNGFGDVRLISTNHAEISDELLKAFRDRRIRVWHSTFCHGVYSAADLPAGWETWQMKMRQPGRPGGFVSFCPNNPEYRKWKKTAVVAVLKRHKFDGIDLTEPFLPAYLGPESPHYGCLCAHCEAVFKAMYPGVTRIPEFEDSTSSDYWKTNRALYDKWVEFRVSTVVEFLYELVNGKDGIRENCPNLSVATWSLGCAMPDQISKLREWEAVDGAAIVKRVRPDIHVIQTDWPDWIKPDLPSSYVERYKPVLESIRAVAPTVPIMLQTDIGSNANMRRSAKWLAEVERMARKIGFSSTTSYEYFIGGYMYDEPPRPVEAEREPGGIRLVFSKRVDPASAGDVRNYTLNSGQVLSAKVDGNIVHLRVPGAESGLIVTASSISDDTARRLYHDKPPCVMRDAVRIPVK